MQRLLPGAVVTLCCFHLLVVSSATAAESSGLGRELAQGVSRLVSESSELLQAPLRTDNGNIMITLGVAGATILAYSFDHDIRDGITGIHGSTMDKVSDMGTLAGDPFLHLGLAALIYGTGYATDSPKWQETGEMLGEALLLADASSLILKESIGRGRPASSGRRDAFSPFSFRQDYDSFPSMHTASAFAAASVMAATSESLLVKGTYYSAASLVGLSRIYKDKHWASDVIFGAALGELCGRVVTNYHASPKRLVMVPQLYDGGGGITMVTRW